MQEMVYVDGPGQVPVARTAKGGFYSFFERPGFLPAPHAMIIGRIGPVDRVTQQRYQPRLRDHLRHSLRHTRVIQVRRGGLPGDSLPSVLPPRPREAMTIPFGALVEKEIEVVRLLTGGGLDVWVLDQEVIEKGRPALWSPDDDEVGQRARPWLLHLLLRSAKLVLYPEYLLLFSLGPLYLLDLLGSLRLALRDTNLFCYLRELPSFVLELVLVLAHALLSPVGIPGPVFVLLSVGCRVAFRVLQECFHAPRYTQSFVKAEGWQAILLLESIYSATCVHKATNA